MLKSNAYGVGSIAVSQILYEEGIKNFGLVREEEIFELLDYWEDKIQIHFFGPVDSTYLDILIPLPITYSVSDFKTIENIQEYSQKLGQKTSIYIHVNTAMGRLGIEIDQIEDFLKSIKSLRHIKLEGFHSHWSMASSHSSKVTQKQKDKFNLLKKKYPHLKLIVNNSEGIIFQKDCIWDGCRPGLMLYGYVDVPSKVWKQSHQSAFPKTSLKESLIFTSYIAIVRKLKKGSTIGYGATYTLKEDSNIATIPVGYSDGYPLALSNKGQVKIQGKLYPVVGRVSMDFITILIGSDHYPKGEEVYLLGGGATSFYKAAKEKGTHVYDILTSISTNQVHHIYQ